MNRERRGLIQLLAGFFLGARSRQSRMTRQDFARVVNGLAQAWSRQDTDQAVALFAPDATYMEPPDVQLYVGREQLRPYFGALRPGTFMRFHHVWFDESTQVGAGEYSFGRDGAETADHGVAVLEMRDGLIAHWREYQRKGPGAFSEFLATEGKNWQWTIANYP